MLTTYMDPDYKPRGIGDDTATRIILTPMRSMYGIIDDDRSINDFETPFTTAFDASAAQFDGREQFAGQEQHPKIGET